MLFNFGPKVEETFMTLKERYREPLKARLQNPKPKINKFVSISNIFIPHYLGLGSAWGLWGREGKGGNKEERRAWG